MCLLGVVKTPDVSTIASLIIAIMSGALPDIKPLSWLYSFMFNSSLPEYLIYGFSTIGLFSLLYNIAIIIISPVACTLNKQTYDWLNKLSTEDAIYIPLLYIVYLLYVSHIGLLTPTAAVLGVFAVMLPFLYRLIVYYVAGHISTTTCYKNFYIFVVSLALTIPATVLYLYIINFILAVL